jgi:ubiquinone/menaquinone biosynthesis C-methylase UbiE
VLQPGEVVVDLGSGAGFDAILAAQQVGPAGRVIGVDMTPAMLAKARDNAVQLGLDNVEFREAYIEALPLEDASVDVIISNGVLNLAPDKRAVLAEAFRILKPGGRLQIADIIVRREVPASARSNIDLWTG